LGPGDKYSIKVDPNATYREYVVATGKKGETILLTSDDFNEYKVIDIVDVPSEESGPVIYKSVPREPRNPRAPKPSNVGGDGCKSKAEEGSNAQVGSVPAVSSAPGVRSVPPASSTAGAGSDPPALSVVNSKGISNQNERVPWYRKLKHWFKST
jgi:hypothetical protein